MAFLHSRHADSSWHAADGKKLLTILLISFTLAGFTCSFPRTPAMFLPSNSLGSKNRFNSKTAKFARDLDIFFISNSSSCDIWQAGIADSIDVSSGGFVDSSSGLEAGGMVHGTGSGIGGVWITAGGTLVTGTESKEIMWSSFFERDSWFSKTRFCLLAMAASSSRLVDRGVDTSFQEGCCISRSTDPVSLAVTMLLLVSSSNSPQDVSEFIRLSLSSVASIG